MKKNQFIKPYQLLKFAQIVMVNQSQKYRKKIFLVLKRLKAILLSDKLHLGIWLTSTSKV